jgi:hypothetical protein
MRYLVAPRVHPAGGVITAPPMADYSYLRTGSWIVLALIGAGGFWLFNAAYKEREEMLREARLSRAQRNPKRKRYYVKIKGERVTYGPYTLKSAKSFARIGSQYGEDRYVRRDRPGGFEIRRYSDGKRVWPVRESQLRGLLSSEQPRRLQSA